jgi:hypothetical protein
MSELYVARAQHPIWRNVFAPIFVPDQLPILGVLAAVCAVVAGLSRDAMLFAFLVVIAYAAYAFTMQRFLPYAVRIGSDDLITVARLLDETPVLLRTDRELRWARKSALPRWLRSRLDQISIHEVNGGHDVRGRKDDMRTLARALNERRAAGKA